MSSWTYIDGTIHVRPPGTGQHAMEFALKEILDHQPLVTGSEGPMRWKIVQMDGYNASCNSDEFGMRTNLKGRNGWWKINDDYIIVLEGHLRDRYYEQTLREFVKWMNRLSKRVWITDMLVSIGGYGRKRIFSDPGFWEDNYRYADMGEPNGLSVRKSCDLRYSLMPETKFWPDILVNLVPGGRKLAHDMDLLCGNCIDEEYLDYDYDGEFHTDISKDVLALFDEFSELHYKAITTKLQKRRNEQ